MDLHLKNKVIVVSGGALGIGQAITRCLATEGAIPVIIGKDQSDNEATVAELHNAGLQADHFVAELSDGAQCKNAIAYVSNKYGRINGLINNAGINDGVGLESGDEARFLDSYKKNALHYYLLAHYALADLKASKGAIVNIISKVAETGQGNTSGYAAANGARSALTREWAVELLPYDIRVNAVIVSESFTDMYRKWIASFEDGAAKKAMIESRIPFQKRMTTPEEIASMVVFLLSPVSSHTTGQLIHVDGGYVHLDRAVK